MPMLHRLAQNAFRTIVFIVSLCTSPIARSAPPATRPAPSTQPAALLPTQYAVPPGKPAFDKIGAKLGQQVPNLSVRNLEGDELELNQLLTRDRPTLLLTSSFTCPRSRSQLPEAAALATRFKGRLSVVILYILEAHPQHDVCPYSGVEEVTAENLREGVLRRQPRTLAERQRLAEEFKDRLHVPEHVTVYLDGMDNHLWQALGGGPNMAVLVSPGGIVLARQGWFDPQPMADRIDRFASAFAVPRGNGPTIDTWATDLSQRRAFTEPTNATSPEAAIKRQPELVRWIEPYKARGDQGGWTMLQAVAAEGPVASAKLLLAHGADVNAQTAQKASPLHLAAARGDVAMIDLLLSSGAAVNLRADVGQGALSPLLCGPTPLEEALVHGNLKAASRLRNAGATASFFTDAALNDVASMKRQLDADPTLAARPDGAGRPPLLYAVGAGAPEAAHLLLSKGATLNRPAYGVQQSALGWAITCKQAEMVRLLLHAGANPDTQDESYPALHAAIYGGSDQMVRTLLDYDADPDAHAQSGESPLHVAAALGRAEPLTMLLKYGANVNDQTGRDVRGCGSGIATMETPLHLAAHSGQLAAAQQLLAAGAKLNVENYDGRTAIDLAGDESMRELLRRHGGRTGSGKVQEQPESKGPSLFGR
jgi:ankyrin repeat protein